MTDAVDPVIGATAPRDNVTVMASAGTGKTWLLITRLVRLLLDGADPGAILAVTFTRKAAGEMQARLTERLSTLAELDGAELEEQLGAIGVAADADGRRAARDLFERLLRAPHPVRATTFHSFCQEILRRFPLDAEVPPGFEVTEDGGLLEQEALDALYTEATAAPEGALAQALNELSRRCRTPAAVAGALQEFLRHRGDWWAYTQNMDDAPAGAATLLAQRLGIDPGKVVDQSFFTPAIETALDEFRGLLGQHQTKINARHVILLADALDHSCSLEERIAAVSEVFVKADGDPRERKPTAAQERSMGQEGQQRFLDLHRDLSEALLQLRERRRRVSTYTLSRAWYEAGARLLDLYQQIKQERRQLDFNDLEWRTYQLLNRGDNAHWVQYKLDQRIDHLLVDEFQDTNPTQWRLLLPLLEELAAGSERRRSVFLVGDIKQSIYRFRRADPALFATARAWLETRLAGKGFPLNASWRSAPRILDFINRVFGAGELYELLGGFEPHASRRQELWGRVELLPLVQPTAGETEASETRSLRNPLQEPRAEDVDRRHYREGRQIAEQIAGLVASGLIMSRGHRSRPISYGDILVLMRNRTHMHDYELALRDAGIPYLGGGRASLLDSLEIRDMVALLEVLTTPYGNLALATVLRSPLFGCSDADLIALALRARSAAPGTQRPWYYLLGELAPTLDPAAPLRRAWDKLQAWKARADRMPVHDLLDHIYCDGGVPACYLAVFPSHLHPRVQSNLMRFLELALEIESGRYPSIPRFVASLRELHRYAQEALEEPPSQPGLAGVRLMTIHAAKGLEAPVVFLLDAARSPTVTRAFQAVVSWPSETARPQHFLLGGRRQEHDDVSAALLDRLAADEAREEANLLYVALTRACQFLYISGCRPKKSGEKLGWYGQLASGLGEEPSRIAAEGWVLADAELPRCAPVTGKVAAIQAGTAPDPRLARPLAITLEAGEVTPSMADSTLMPDAGEDRVETGPGSEEERQRGKAIHRMLDLLTSPGAAPAPAALAGEFGLDPFAPELQEWWREARAVVALAELRDCFDPTRYRRAYNEIPVYHAQDGLVVHGVIDRLVMHPSGLTLIDYKTRRAAGSDPLERIAVRYRAQLRLYRNAVRRLWPEPPLRVLLVFTASARVFECTEEFLGGHGGA